MVRLHGLKDASFNGKLGQILPDTLHDDGRYLVALCDDDSQGGRLDLSQQIQLRVKTENMLLACDHCFITEP